MIVQLRGCDETLSSSSRDGSVKTEKRTTRDLIVEEFQDIHVAAWQNSVTLYFADDATANRVYFSIKNALDLGLPVQFRTKTLRADNKGQ